MTRRLAWLVWLYCPLAFAALQGDTAWEVRATGNNNNGACYDTGGTGTDYSQQDAAQLSLTDLAQTLSSTTLTSATGGFTSAMVDNCIRIHTTGTGPFTAGYYEITAFTDSNTVTIDRTACSTANCSGGGGNVGGAAADPEQVTAGVASGHTVHIKAGTYAVTVSADTGGVKYLGYNATRGDHPTGANRPLIDCQSTRANGITTNNTTQLFRNLRIANCTGAGILETGGNLYWNVKSSNHSGPGLDDRYANATTRYCVLCELASNSAGCDASSQTNNSCTIHASYVHDNSGRGVASGGGTPNTFLWSVAETNGSHGVDTAGTCVNSISHGNTGVSDGFRLISTANLYLNCVATSNGQYGFSGTTGNIALFDYNAYNGNTTANLSNVTAGPHDVTGAPNFTNAGSGDFTINATSALLGAGFPQDVSADIGLTGDYQANIGVDQDDNASGGVGPFQPVGSPTIIIR